MYCVIQEIAIKKAPVGEPKEIEVYESNWTMNDIPYTTYGYKYSQECYEREVKKAYRISIHESFREGSRIRKKQTVICTIGYYDLVDMTWIGEYVRGKWSDKVKAVGLPEEELENMIYDKLQPLIDQVMEGPVGDAIDSALKFLGKLVKAIQLLWEEVLLPFITWLIKTMVPILAPIIETIGNVFLNVFGAIAETISGVFDVLSGLIDFITGVFTGDWEKAWKGIKEIFAGIWKQLEAVVEAIVNSIIDIVNGFVKTVSTAIEKAIESFNKGYEKGKSLSDNKYGGGGRTFSSYSVSPYTAYSNNVPQLASGTVVPPKAGNFLAMLGDNNKDYEVVSPLETMKQAFKEAIGEMGGIGGGTVQADLILDGTKFGQLVWKYNNKENDRVGVRMVTNGG